MYTFFWLFISVIILQRLYELKIAKRNERWMKERGAIEFGQEHYKWFIILHTLFFVVLIGEVMYLAKQIEHVSYFFLLLFIATQAGRIWCILSLGQFWNTKVIILPKVALIKKGPYKYVKHPNYIIVALELFIIPFIFGAYITAYLFPFLHLLLLFIRVPTENRALARANIESRLLYHQKKW